MKWFVLAIFLTISLYAHQEGEEKNPSFERGWVGVEIFGGPLYWHAKVGGTEYVYSLAKGKGAVESQSFDWDFGYRLGGGVFLPLFKWEVLGIYTHYGTQDSEGKGVTPPSLLVKLKGSGQVFSHQVKSTYHIDYDALSLELQRSSFLGRLLGLGSSLGVKQTWIEQNQKVIYRESTVKDRCRFRGMGPLLGMHLNWPLFSGISFWGECKAALLYGHFEVKHTEAPIALKGDTHLFSPNLSFQFGLRQDIPLGAAQLFFSLGYEADYYWRQNQALALQDYGRPVKVSRYAEDLVFYGLSGRFGVEF
ncbi:MAG: hypothetical protein KDK64_05815 [Chlamydiia bacterium]|nr:hypothetical protein [Chlamydiia bacterium]